MIVIVDYGMGNVGAIANMLRKCDAEVLISSLPSDIEQADKIILPGVGSFDHGIQALRAQGLIPLIEHKVLQCQTPILGICLGLQLFTETSEEGREPGLGWIAAETRRFKFQEPTGQFKIPHMGWNRITFPRTSQSSLCGLDVASRYYFVHSYHVVCRDAQDVLATTSYGYEFTSAIRRDNIIGVQFHPEKSHRYGLAFLRHFKDL